MIKKNNIVGHCFRPSQNNDKVYMCCIRHTGPLQWTVLAKWGRRGKKLNVQAKATYSLELSAVQYQQTLWKEQEKDGYLDIESVKYADYMKANDMRPHSVEKSGILLTLKSEGIKENLEPEDWDIKDADSPLSDDFAGLLPVWQCESCGSEWHPKLNFDNQPDPDQDNLCPKCFDKIHKSPGDKFVPPDEVMVCIDNAGIEGRFDVGIEYLVEKHKDETMVYVYDKMGQKDEFFKVRFLTHEQWEAKQGKIKFKVLKERESKSVDKKKMEFAKINPGDKIRIIQPDTPIAPHKHFISSYDMKKGFLKDQEQKEQYDIRTLYRD
jgi:hypothetical protein